ncbi:50S ribosomal protein L44e [Candidatus Bathyarchaeota archaeon]|nr:50S ribosomal protein L44e [Candidatus Bathyarchaeota archaeon]
MKHPRNIRRYCPKCGKHTEHSVSIYKKRPKSRLKQGERRYARKSKGYGSFPRPVFKRNAKVNKKFLPMLTCKECDRKSSKKGLRLKRFELV